MIPSTLLLRRHLVFEFGRGGSCSGSQCTPVLNFGSGGFAPRRTKRGAILLTGFKFQQGRWVSCSSQLSRPVLGPTQPPIEWVPGPFTGSKGPVAIVNISHPYRAQIKSKSAILMIPIFALIACKRLSLPFTIPSTCMCFSLCPSIRFLYQTLYAYVPHAPPSSSFLIHRPYNVSRSVQIMYEAVPHYATCTCLCYSPTLQSKHYSQHHVPNTPQGVLSL